MKRIFKALSLVLAFALATPAPTWAGKGGGHSSSSKGGGHHSGSKSSGSSSKPVHVKGYTKKDGTYVPPHDRAALKSKGSVSSSPSSSSGSHPKSSSACTSCERDKNGTIKRDPKAKAEFMRETGYPEGRPGYVVDHRVPLECGGSDSPSNMQWQTKAEAKAKDKTEGDCRR